MGQIASETLVRREWGRETEAEAELKERCTHRESMGNMSIMGTHTPGWDPWKGGKLQTAPRVGLRSGMHCPVWGGLVRQDEIAWGSG